MATTLQRILIGVTVVAGAVFAFPNMPSSTDPRPAEPSVASRAVSAVRREPLPQRAAWTRTFALPVSTFDDAEPAPVGALDAQRLFARIAGGVAGLDVVTGATLFTEKADVYDADDGRLAIANHSGLAVIRPGDASVAWRVPSGGVTAVAMTGGRVAALQQCRLTIFDVDAPRLRKSQILPALRCPGLQNLRHGYVFVLVAFDGAWMGTVYHATDLATGRDAWSRTDATLLGSTATTLSLQAQQSMMPWAPAGWNAEVRRSDGVVVSVSPPPIDPNGGDVAVRGGDVAFVLSRGTIRRYGALDDKFMLTPDGHPDGGRVVMRPGGCDDVALRAMPAAVFALCSRNGENGANDADATLYRLDLRRVGAEAARAVARFALWRTDGPGRGYLWRLIGDRLAIFARGRLRLFYGDGVERRDLVLPCDDALANTDAALPATFVASRIGRSLVVSCRFATFHRIFAFPDASARTVGAGRAVANSSA